MIALAGVFARGAAGRGKAQALLKGVTLARAGGVLSIVGAPIDGTSLLLSVVAGLVPARAGQALVAGKPAAGARRLVAYAPTDPALPEALRVDEICELAAELRGEPPDAAARLSALGVEALGRRRARSLSPSEARTVSLAIALGSRAPILLLDEPLSTLAPSAPGRVVELVRDRAASDATVLVTTASVRDATKLGDELAVLTQGVLGPLPPALAHVGREGARLRVVVAGGGVSSLVAVLAEDPAVKAVEATAFAAPGASAVLASGPDLLALAGAITRAAAKTGADVELIESAVVPLDAIRSSLASPRAEHRPLFATRSGDRALFSRSEAAALPSRPPPAGSVPPSGGAP